MSVNKVTLLGHTGKAPDFKTLDNDVKRYITEIVATNMEMLTPKGTGTGTQTPPPPADVPAPDEIDDLPF